MALTTAAIIVKGERLFLARRKASGSMGSRWEFPGGKVEEGETPEKALIRELNEEFGVPSRVLEFLGSVEFVHNSIPYSLLAFWVEWQTNPHFLEEHTEVGWFSLEEIEQLDLADSDRALFEKLKDSLKLHFHWEQSRS
ncbi:MAG: (deoxy)nucleoside triphosphate pyrophosphohydrolase [Spirochaetales bacterium]